MTADPQHENAAEERFVASAESRIRRWFVILAFAAEAVFLISRRWPLLAGFTLGVLAAWLSMVHLQRVVHAFTARAAAQGNARGGAEPAAEPAAATIMRFLMRFAIVTLIAYVIFRVSRTALYGYVAALFLPVAAMMCEAVYEAWFALFSKSRSGARDRC